MSANSNISWTDHTFNPWWGCAKISPGCEHCYADTFALRCGFGGEKGTKDPIWGKNAARRFFGDKHWKEPLEWNDSAYQASRRPRVFCASMSDWLEDRKDLTPHLARLLALIHATPNLDWLLLTKRPENWARRMQSAMAAIRGPHGTDEPDKNRLHLSIAEWIVDETPPANVWIGTTVENQEYADRRIPELLKIPARVRFLSVEPMLGKVDLMGPLNVVHRSEAPTFDGPWKDLGYFADEEPALYKRERIHWVICGGESGAKRRPFEGEWAQSLADQCAAAGVAFHMKQDAGQHPGKQGRLPDELWNRKEFPNVAAVGTDG